MLVVSDVLETLTLDSGEYSWDSLGKIVLIAAVRTALAFFLGRELSEIEEKIEGHNAHSGNPANEVKPKLF